MIRNVLETLTLWSGWTDTRPIACTRPQSLANTEIVEILVSDLNQKS